MCRRPSAEAGQGLDRLRTGDPIGGQPCVRLELGQRLRGARAEDAVDATGIEPERPEASLQLGDVVAPLHRPAQVEETVAEPVPGLDDRAPGLLVTEPVGLQAPRDLERLHRSLGCGTEPAVLIAPGIEPGGCEPALEIAYRLTCCAEAQWQAFYRNSLSS